MVLELRLAVVPPPRHKMIATSLIFLVRQIDIISWLASKPGKASSLQREGKD